MVTWSGRYRALLLIGAILGSMVFLPQSSLSSGPTYVSGDVTGNVVWTADQSPIVVVGNTTVTANSVLTVQAGTEVRFEYLRKITVNGQIVVDGQPGSEVTFTSNLSSPYAGSWVAIEILDSLDQPVSSFNYCEVQFGGYGLWASSSNVLIRNTTVSEVLERGIYAVDSELNVYDSVVEGSPMIGIDITSSWGELNNNLVKSSGSWGIMIYDSDVSLVGNILEVSGTSMLISDSSATVGGGNVIDGGSTGIRLDRANGTDIRGIIIQNTGYAVVAQSCSNLTISDSLLYANDMAFEMYDTHVSIVNSSLSFTINLDFWLKGESRAIMAGSLYDQTKVQVASDSSLIIDNFLRIRTAQGDDTPVENATAKIGNDQVLVATRLTDSAGMTDWVRVRSRTYLGSSIPEESITEVEVEVEGLGFVRNPRIVDMSTSHTEVFRVVGSPPVVEIDYPTLQTEVENTVIARGTAHDADGSVVDVKARVENGPWIKADATSLNWSTWEVELDFSGLSEGYYFIEVIAQDSDNLTGRAYIQIKKHLQDDSEASMLYWIAGVIVVASSVGLLAIFMKRRNKDRGKIEEMEPDNEQVKKNNDS